MAKVGGGHIVKREKGKSNSKCRKWELRVPTGFDPGSGTYRKKCRRFKGTYSEAKQELLKFMEEVEADEVQSRTSYTFERYCERYLERREARREVAATTLRRQRWQLKAACRHIGKAELSTITPTMIDDMYIAMLQGDTLSGKKSSGSYVNQIHSNILLVFDQAIKEGILVKNPCHAANPPKMDTREKRALSADRAHAFIAMLDEKRDRECAYLLAITMGLRRGEICGLSWGDVDFERGILDISHSYDVMGNLKGTKTRAGTRLLPLPESVSRALAEHKRAQKLRYDRTNQWRKPEEGYIEQGDNSPVISDIGGSRVLPSSLSRWWIEDRGRFGLDGWGLHELRHTYLTMLALSGVHPKVMQALAGHYSSQITMDIYTHVNMDAKKEAVAAVSRVF